jgi:uncharacterized repeat protein (TIGR02543 family)
MDNKLIAILAAVVLVIAGVGVAVFAMNQGENVTGTTYQGNGGTTSDGKTSYTLSNTTAQESMFSRDGYSFVEWNSAADGSGKSYAVGSAVTDKLTIYAQWKQITPTGPILLCKAAGTTSLFEAITMTVTDTNGESTDVEPSLIGVKIGIHPSETDVIKVSFAGGSNWVLDESGTKPTFRGTINGVSAIIIPHVYDVNGSSVSVTCSMVGGNPTVTFILTDSGTLSPFIASSKA